jgi:tetratricopeptide (TPR) repeat protein
LHGIARAEALGQTGKQLFHLGSYDTALKYLQQSLAISQEIGDVAGLCATLFNMGHIHWQNEDQAQALQAWVTVYKLARQLNLAQALQALEKLAGQIGLPGGLQGWDALAQKMEEGS